MDIELTHHLFSIFCGLLAGSFTNVLIYRMPRKMDWVMKRSHCTSCDRVIPWYENIPALSYLALRGKCSSCGSKISIRYPVVELLTAFLFLATETKWGLTPLTVLRDWPMMLLFMAITFIDLEHRLIPDRLSFPGVTWALLTSYWVPNLGLLGSVLGAAIGFGLFYLVALYYEKRSGQMGLGGGDIKLLAMIGAYSGVPGVFTTLFVSSICGTLAGIVWAKASRQESLLKTSIPFGPFLVIGALYYALLGDILWLPFGPTM
jgi:leader peptidase (prepilin peptidase)/N-methyltransferase